MADVASSDRTSEASTTSPRALPPPGPSSPAARAIMRANRSRDTGPELALRRVLHRRGLRYRLEPRIQTKGRVVRPDIVFVKRRVAVFVDGCFWHRCPNHAGVPKANSDYWQAKFERNVARDRADNLALTGEGWAVVRVWEHEDASLAADRIEGVLAGPVEIIDLRQGLSQVSVNDTDRSPLSPAAADRTSSETHRASFSALRQTLLAVGRVTLD